MDLPAPLHLRCRSPANKSFEQIPRQKATDRPFVELSNPPQHKSGGFNHKWCPSHTNRRPVPRCAATAAASLPSSVGFRTKGCFYCQVVTHFPPYFIRETPHKRSVQVFSIDKLDVVMAHTSFIMRRKVILLTGALLCVSPQ